MSVRGLRGLATPTLWGAALRQRCDRYVQRPRLNLLLEHDHSPELAWLERYHQIHMVSGKQCSECYARRCPNLRGRTVTRGGAIRSLIGLTTRGLQVHILLALPIFVWQAQE